MTIIDLNQENLPLYFVCLEDWSDEIKEAGDRKEQWYRVMKEKGLRVKLALDDQGVPGGMIQYIPIESSFAEGSDLYVILCIWVHGHKQGRGDFRHRGFGKALLLAAEEDVRSLGAKGIVAWGLLIPVFMRASWFRRHGYRTVDRIGLQSMVWKPFASDAIAPKFIRGKIKPIQESNNVTVTALCNGWCPAQNMVMERAKRACADPAFNGKVVYNEVDTLDRRNFLQWGISDALFIGSKEIRTGPPPAYEKIHALIAKRVHKLPQS